MKNVILFLVLQVTNKKVPPDQFSDHSLQGFGREIFRMIFSDFSGISLSYEQKVFKLDSVKK